MDFADNPNIEANLPRNPTTTQLKEVVDVLLESVNKLNGQVDKLNKEVYKLEELNFKLNRKVNSVKHMAEGSGIQKHASQEELMAMLEAKKKQDEEKEKKRDANRESFGGGGMFFDFDDESEGDGPLEHGLGHDTFSLLKVKPVLSRAWLYTTLIYFLQVALLIMIIIEQRNAGDESTPFNIPFRVDAWVRTGQVIGLLVTISLSRDIFLPIKELQTLWFTNDKEWLQVTGPLHEKKAFPVWCMRILLPNIFQVIVGCLATFISFVIIIQSADVISLFANFAAMSVIAELDNIAFWFAENGYVGDVIMNDAKIVQDVTISEEVTNFNLGCFSISFRSLLFIFLTLLGIAGYVPFAYLQTTGVFFTMKYPNCALDSEGISKMGDEVCNGGIQNSIECGFDHGDCIEFNIGYPGCSVINPITVGDGQCNKENNSTNCKYDGGDCCPIKTDHSQFLNYLGDDDKKCHAGFFFTKECLYDFGDCDKLRENYPNCKGLYDLILDDDGLPIEIGTGVCDKGKENLAAYMTEDCGWVFGDCLEVKERADKRKQQFPSCTAKDLFRIGDGKCDRGEFNYLNEQCGWDMYDCCDLDISKIGDGNCDSTNVTDYLTPECGYEGLYDVNPRTYDCCPERTLDLYVNNDICGDTFFDFTTFQPIAKEDLAYNKECAFEGTDCFIPEYPTCQVDVAKYVGDGVCNGLQYNVEACGFDGGDCLEINERYPLCNNSAVANLDNGLCDKEILNTQECGYDGGDCIFFNSRYPNCSVGDQMFKIGNGFCDHGQFQPYNSPLCNYDGGDCDADGNQIFNPLSQFSVDYPNCHAEIPNYVGDGKCRGEYNTQECGWDGGDCLELNLRKVRLGLGDDCIVDYPEFLGDDVCNGGEYNTEECGFDAGDCLDFNQNYPNCTTNFPRQVGNGICDADENVEQCGWDGGDCYMEQYPDCHAPHPRYIGDGECDADPIFNNEECGWDGGDCEDYNNQ